MWVDNYGGNLRVCIEHNSRFHSDSFATWRFILDERAMQHTRSPTGGILLFDPIAKINICVPNIQKVYYILPLKKALSTWSNCISQTMTVKSMFQTSALCFSLFPLKLSVCVCACVWRDLAQDHHLQECKLVSSFFMGLWTLLALSIPSHSMHPCHLTRNVLRVPACFPLPVYAAGISGWEACGFLPTPLGMSRVLKLVGMAA